MSVRDKVWIWGHNIGSHDMVAKSLSLPLNKMSPAQACEFFGCDKVCRVVYGGKPEPPFDSECEELKNCSQVVWSIIGDAGSTRTNGGTSDLDEVIRVAKKYPNITGAIMDDFLHPSRIEGFPPEMIEDIAAKLHEVGLKLWMVIYTHQLDPQYKRYLDACDCISLWTWCSKDLKDAEENFYKLKNMLRPEKEVYSGCYLYDYGMGHKISPEVMQDQLDLYKKLMDSGESKGVILCSNCIADIGLETVDITKKWIDEND